VSLDAINQILQFIAWFLALIEFIIGLYVLALNAWHIANRHVGALFFLFAINNYALGAILSAGAADETRFTALLLALTTAIVQPALLITAIVLLKPDWLRSRWRRLIWLVYAAIYLPVIFTLSDIFRGTQLWFSGMDPVTYHGGYAALSEYTQGSLAFLVQVPNIYLASVVLTGLLLWFQRQASLTHFAS
jgi:hypothetical protein